MQDIEAGYEKVTIFVADERLPLSVHIQKGSTGTYWGQGTASFPFKVVCGAPEQRGPHYKWGGNGCPKMWSIVKKLGLNPKGGGSGDGHDIHPVRCPDLKAGYYEV